MGGAMNRKKSVEKTGGGFPVEASPHSNSGANGGQAPY